MRRAMSVCAALALLAVTTTVANAQGGQGRGRGGMFGGGGLMMLGIPEVQQELKMTQPQIDKLQGAQQGMREKMQEVMQSAGGPEALRDPANREKLMAQVQEVQTKAVKEILDTTQFKRFHQLELQQMGPQALGRKDVAEALKLTEKQRSDIQAAQQAAMQQQMEVIQGAGGFQQLTDADRKKLEDLRAGTATKIAAVLTDDQKKQWEEMLGAKFKFPERRPRA